MRRIIAGNDFERIIALYCSVFKARAQVGSEIIFGERNAPSAAIVDLVHADKKQLLSLQFL
jgi:hypothetical protein